MTKLKVSVYLDDGRVFEYDVDSPEKAREHSFAIISTGYRHVTENFLEHYPPYRISKVKVSGLGILTSYPDSVRGT